MISRRAKWDLTLFSCLEAHDFPREASSTPCLYLLKGIRLSTRSEFHPISPCLETHDFFTRFPPYPLSLPCHEAYDFPREVRFISSFSLLRGVDYPRLFRIFSNTFPLGGGKWDKTSLCVESRTLPDREGGRGGEEPCFAWKVILF